ncbi:uncharacterized protein KD926_003163 [Aspergillus affinis]|uniref:uncharacterized protein n=1 Tax=Aspergillus affinis TaxID=1070780 RepID=UPI0022FE3D19|nr:uncharacterized protein KD926_003163 [Aspergillus affinis]KAI9035652.1 hypothetical protein KD926_003163 [Aspergillus affinis]
MIANMSKRAFIAVAIFAMTACCLPSFSQIYYGAARLYAYQHFVGNGYIASIVEDCNVKEGEKKLKYLQCAGDALTYMFGAAMAIGESTSRTGAAAEYIANQGQTLWVRENDFQPMWNWASIDESANNFYEHLGHHLPRDMVLTGGNITHFGLEGNAAVVKHHEGHLYIHANNVTHDVVGKYRLPEQKDLTKRTTYTWNFGELAGLKYSYVNAVRDSSLGGRTKVVTHLAHGYDVELQNWFYDLVLDTGLLSVDDWYVIPVLLYRFWGEGATMDALNTSLTSLPTKYNKEVQAVERNGPTECTNPEYPFPEDQLDIPLNSAGQIEYLQRLASTLKAMPNATGLNYWEPVWIDNAGLGSSCEKNVMFDSSGQAFDSLCAFDSLSTVVDIAICL